MLQMSICSPALLGYHYLGGNKMLVYTVSLSEFSTDVSWGLARIVDFGPQLMWIVGLGILGLAVLIALYDTWWEPRKVRQVPPPVAPAPDLSKPPRVPRTLVGIRR